MKTFYQTVKESMGIRKWRRMPYKWKKQIMRESGHFVRQKTKKIEELNKPHQEEKFKQEEPEQELTREEKRQIIINQSVNKYFMEKSQCQIGVGL